KGPLILNCSLLVHHCLDVLDQIALRHGALWLDADPEWQRFRRKVVCGSVCKAHNCASLFRQAELVHGGCHIGGHQKKWPEMDAKRTEVRQGCDGRGSRFRE